MMDLQMDFRTGGIPPPTIDTPSPTACLSTSNSTSAFVNTAGYPNCELSSKLLRSTRIGVAVQLSNAFPLPAATNYPLFNISLLEENSNQQCSIRFAFVMTPSGGIGFASDWTGGTVTNPNSAIFIGPGDRIALTAAPYNYLYRFNTALKVVVRLWYSTSNANLDMNATKGVPWRFWGEAVLQGPLEGCGRLIPAVLNTNFSNSMIQAIYMQKGAQGVEVEPSLGQNLFPNGGADQGEEGSWFVTSTPQPTTSNWTFTVNGASPGKSFQFNFTKVTNAGLGQEQVGLTQISIQPALIPDTTYFLLELCSSFPPSPPPSFPPSFPLPLISSLSIVLGTSSITMRRHQKVGLKSFSKLTKAIRPVPIEWIRLVAISRALIPISNAPLR